MIESPAVLAFAQNMYLSAAIARLGLIQKNWQDFAALGELYKNALESHKWCYGTQRWDLTLDLMTALKEFLHLQGHWQEASQYVDHALDAAKQLGDVKAQANWTLYAALLQSEQGNCDEAESLYRQSLDLAKDEPGIQAEAWRRLGWLAHARGDRREAEQCYQQAIELHRRLKERQGEARDRRQLGILAMETGDFDRAVKYLQTSLTLIEGSTGRETQQLQASVELDLGRIALRQAHLDEARRRLKAALTGATIAQDRLLLADVYFHLAMLAEKTGDFQEATKQYQERLSLARETGDRWGVATSLIALGNLLLQQPKSDYVQAGHYYEEALKFGDRHNCAVALAQLGTLAYLQGDYEQATAHLQKALGTFQDLNHRQEMADCHQQLGLVAQARRQWREAGEHYQTSLDLRLGLSLFSEAVQSIYQLGTLAQRLGQCGVARRYYQQALTIGKQINFSNLAVIRRALESLPPD